MKTQIGNIELRDKLILAPMAGVTDLPFRLLCKEQGCDILYTEMVSAKALLYNDEKTKLLLKTCDKERPLAVQIFGSDAEAIAYASKYVSEFADIVDIDYPHGEFTSVQYDTTDGIKMQGIAEYLRDDGETYQIPTDIDVPLVAGVGISIDK